MSSDQVLILSFWNPTEENPQQGIFIQDQAASVCKMRDNVIFLQVNILFSKNILIKRTIEESRWNNNRRIVLNLYSRLWKFWYVNPWILSWEIYCTVIKKLPGIEPKIIHSNVIFPCGVVGYLLAKRLNARTLISEHWSKAEKLLTHPLYRGIALKAYRRSEAIICVSGFLSKKIAGITGHKNILIIPNIIDSQLFNYIAKDREKTDVISFMCVASWRLPKRLDLIIESLNTYSAEAGKEIVLTVVGKGPQAEQLKNRKYHQNLKIEWSGYLDKSSIAALLHSVSYFLHASEIETFSIVTAEALSTGTPVIASRTGALPELINEENGILAENNHDSWLNAIREIVSKDFDHELIARKNQARFSSESTGRSIISLYDKF